MYDRIACTVVVSSGRAPAAEGRGRARAALQAAGRARAAAPGDSSAALGDLRRLLTAPHLKVSLYLNFGLVEQGTKSTPSDKTKIKKKHLLPFNKSIKNLPTVYYENI